VGQIFHPSLNTISRLTIFGGVALVAIVLSAWAAIMRSPYVNEVGVAREQPVPFSHKHHVAGLGLDCRYCHTSVEESRFAGIPPTSTCMTCHSQVWNTAPMLEPVRASFKDDRSIEWVRVHDLPDFAYFDHSVHVTAGVGCESCHGRVDKMPLTWRVNSLDMEWCLECHRAPERHLRPKERVFEMGYTGPNIQRDVDQRRITNCSACHR
jgi:hypothetical protein